MKTRNGTLLFIFRNKIFSITICITLFLVFLGEYVSIILMKAADKGKDDAFIYTGSALMLTASEDCKLTKEDYEYIEKLEHVTGIGGHFREIIATPIDTKNVKDHTGASVDEVNSENADNMVIVAVMNLKKYDLFRRERNVSIMQGEFPENDGVLIEKRYAEKNDINVGDSVDFDTYLGKVSLKVKGIFYADCEFEILESNDVGGDAYLYSPYNTVYMEYDYALQIFDMSDARQMGCNIFVDEFENIEYVKEQLIDYFGQSVEIFDIASDSMQSQCAIVSILNDISGVIKISFFIGGTIILLIVISFIYDKLKHSSGIYLAIGDSKSCVVGRNICIFAMYSLISMIMCFLFMMIFQNVLLDLINNKLYDYGTSGSNGYGNVYLIHGILENFYVTVDKCSVFSFDNVEEMMQIFIYGIMVSVVLPVISSVKASPKELLSK